MDSGNVIEWVRRFFGSTSVNEIDRERATELTDRAPGDSITVPTLVNETGYSSQPLLTYLEADEQPAYLLSGTEVIVDDADLGMVQEHPTMRTQVLVTDERIVIVIGNSRSDDLWGIPIDSIQDIRCENVRRQAFLAIEAVTNEEEKVFYVNITIQVDTEELRDAIVYVDSLKEDETG